MKIPKFIIRHIIIFGALTILLLILAICGVVIYHPMFMLELIIGSLGLFIVGLVSIYDWKKNSG